MNLTIPQTQIKIKEIIEHPELYQEEVQAAALATIKAFTSELYEAKKIIEGRLIERMEADNATKLKFLLNDEEHTATLSAGSVECKNKTIAESYELAGFQPLEIGDYVFKPSWSKAKEARKLGGAKQEIIDKYFIAGQKSLKIE